MGGVLIHLYYGLGALTKVGVDPGVTINSRKNELATTLFRGMGCHSDKDGKGPNREREIHGRRFPVDVLNTLGHVYFYIAGNKCFVLFRKRKRGSEREMNITTKK